MSIEEINELLDKRLKAILDPDGKLAAGEDDDEIEDELYEDDDSVDVWPIQPAPPTEGTPRYEADKLKGCINALVVIFALLRVFGAIDWPLLWILSPWWGRIALRALIAFVRLMAFKFQKGA